MENRMLYRWSFRLGVLLAAIILLAVWPGDVSAAPAAPTEFELTQPDGSTFTGRLWGDEWQNGYETVTGYTILREKDGWWVYAAPAENGTLAPQLHAGGARFLVGKTDPRGLTPHLRPVEKNMPANAQSGELSPNSGSQPTLVLLVKFNNYAESNPATYFQNKIFGATDSVQDFYLDASFNQLTLSPASESDGTPNDGVVGWLTLPYPRPNLSGTPDNDNQTIVKDALIAANSAINYAGFDSNIDGYISNIELHIVVVVAGFEQSYDGTTTSSVWGHRWNLNNVGGVFLDGKWLGVSPYGGYAQFGEIQGDHAATMGIIAHELGHDLTWPDLYDTDQSSEGVGDWSIMGAGSWNNTFGGYPGNSPAMPDAFLKWYQGWITPTTVSGIQPGSVINQAETNPQAYLLGTNPGGVNWNFDVASGVGEYFLVENRQLTGYDVGLPGCGLLITHIDESVTFDNDANANEFHPLVKIIEADGLNQLVFEANNRGDTGDPFPGATNNQLFNFSTNPNSRFYDNSDSLAAVSSISPCSSAMTATLTYGSVPMNNKVFLPLIQNGIPPAPGTDPIRNGSFEAGRDGNWTEISPGVYDLVTNDLPLTPHGGSWATWLGGEYNAANSITQTGIQVGGLRYLHYWYWIASQDDLCGWDNAEIYINGNLQTTLNLCTDTDSTGWVHGLLDLNSYLAATISLEFRVTTDGYLNSNFFLDDVSISGSPAFSPSVNAPRLNGLGAELKK